MRGSLSHSDASITDIWFLPPGNRSCILRCLDGVPDFAAGKENLYIAHSTLLICPGAPGLRPYPVGRARRTFTLRRGQP